MADELIKQVLHEAGETDEQIAKREQEARLKAEKEAKTEPTEDADLLRHVRPH